MQRSDKTEITTELGDQISTDQAQEVLPVSPASSPSSQSREQSFHWSTLGVVLLIAALFAIAARIHPQPATSFVPAAVLSASGCGLLVTALRKLRTARGPGLLEAGLGGLFLAIFQFLAAITYPGVFQFLSTDPIQRQAFLTTWGLIASFSLIFSMVGAVLGHLAFAPPRPLPAKSRPIEKEEDAETDEEQRVDELQPPRTVFSYFVTILLLGLAPTVIGYVFSAAYDYSLSLNQLLPGPLPTLRLLSALLPWQIPVLINLIPSNASFIIFTLLWRVPLFFGNPTMFDLQALEPFVYNGAALGILLLTMYRAGASSSERNSLPSWRLYLLLEGLFGLVLILPSNLWALRGLHGLLQFQNLAIPIPGLQILNPLTFVLNLVTGPFVCLAIGRLLYRAYKKRIKIL